jgi:hypothetical protein
MWLLGTGHRVGGPAVEDVVTFNDSLYQYCLRGTLENGEVEQVVCTNVGKDQGSESDKVCMRFDRCVDAIINNCVFNHHDLHIGPDPARNESGQRASNVQVLNCTFNGGFLQIRATSTEILVDGGNKTMWRGGHPGAVQCYINNKQPEGPHGPIRDVEVRNFRMKKNGNRPILAVTAGGYEDFLSDVREGEGNEIYD